MLNCLLSLLLTSFHVLKFDLSGDHGASLSATVIAFCQRKETVRIRLGHSPHTAVTAAAGAITGEVTVVVFGAREEIGA